jgi:hypothetical protein
VALKQLPARNFVVDGELAISVGGRLSFDELLLRLHPAASRVAKLAKTHPAILIVFDLLAEDRQSHLQRSLRERRLLLEKFAFDGAVKLSPATTNLKQAQKWFDKVGGDLDGIVAKRLDWPYAAGQRDAIVKVKKIRTVDCVVGGFRYASRQTVLGSLLLGLYSDNGLLHQVGFTSAIKASERRALQKIPGVAQVAGIHRQRAGAGRAAGPQNGAANGNLSILKSWSKSPTTISPVAGSATAPDSSAGAPTNRRANAHWIRSAVGRANRSRSCSETLLKP